VHWDHSLSAIGLQKAKPIWLDMEKVTKVSLGYDILPKQPRSFPRPHAGQQAYEKHLSDFRIVEAEQLLSFLVGGDRVGVVAYLCFEAYRGEGISL
tara:strand:+ start:202 stop:489 length:288 start_codon:yes stop_codon:yes gene_type:complete